MPRTEANSAWLAQASSVRASQGVRSGTGPVSNSAHLAQTRANGWRIYVTSTVFKYAAAIFEGIRAYHNEQTNQLYIFRLKEHLDRLHESAKIARIPLPYTAEQIRHHLVKLIKENELRQDLHIRISAYVSEDDGRLLREIGAAHLAAAQ